MGSSLRPRDTGYSPDNRTKCPSSIHRKDAVIKRKYFLQVLYFIIPKLSRLQCLIHEAGCKKSPKGPIRSKLKRSLKVVSKNIYYYCVFMLTQGWDDNISSQNPNGPQNALHKTLFPKLIWGCGINIYGRRARRQMGRTSWRRSGCSFCVRNGESRMEIQCYKHNQASPVRVSRRLRNHHLSYSLFQGTFSAQKSFLRFLVSPRAHSWAWECCMEPLMGEIVTRHWNSLYPTEWEPARSS